MIKPRMTYISESFLNLSHYRTPLPLFATSAPLPTTKI